MAKPFATYQGNTSDSAYTGAAKQIAAATKAQSTIINNLGGARRTRGRGRGRGRGRRRRRGGAGSIQFTMAPHTTNAPGSHYDTTKLTSDLLKVGSQNQANAAFDHDTTPRVYASAADIPRPATGGRRRRRRRGRRNTRRRHH